MKIVLISILALFSIFSLLLSLGAAKVASIADKRAEEQQRRFFK